METEIISDEDIADVAATKKVAEIFFDRLLEMYLQCERRFFWIYLCLPSFWITLSVLSYNNPRYSICVSEG
ncbi:hypothetical protein PIB30_101852 [Stylosanthes scabra]|uniref:Uncharacterized protein n=1 Tax=Stylosanthes scabra TaxID=79078 RepID=A0ABU6UFQ2_9FABA|nr:hypothetical protein [Stylosanthes scabra]MED6202086.1 hypothetical protein [Stylosanthes scabra]